MATEQPFAPVQSDYRRPAAIRIPWWLHHRAWLAYAAFGHGSQDAETIAKRGGFGEAELVGYLADPPQDGPHVLTGPALARYRSEVAEATPSEGPRGAVAHKPNQPNQPTGEASA